ncbi:MAG: anthranilate synthase component I, partial [Actinobacteria bacterium]|nr:anthranilate synthase component I [Actinomycetota bacterium]
MKDAPHRPDLETYIRLREKHNVVPVWREVMADLQTPVAAFLRLDPQPNGFLLESVEGGERWARYSFLGGDTFATVTARRGQIDVEGDPPVLPNDGESPLAYIRRLLEAFDAPEMEELPPLHGGAVGFLGYDVVRELEVIGEEPDDDLGLPDAVLLLTRTFVVFDHLKQKAFVITNVATPGDPVASYREAQARCDEVVERLAAPLSLPQVELELASEVAFETSVDDAEYRGWVETAKEHVMAGDVFQV